MIFILMLIIMNWLGIQLIIGGFYFSHRCPKERNERGNYGIGLPDALLSVYGFLLTRTCESKVAFSHRTLAANLWLKTVSVSVLHFKLSSVNLQMRRWKKDQYAEKRSYILQPELAKKNQPSEKNNLLKKDQSNLQLHLPTSEKNNRPDP